MKIKGNEAYPPPPPPQSSARRSKMWIALIIIVIVVVVSVAAYILMASPANNNGNNGSSATASPSPSATVLALPTATPSQTPSPSEFQTGQTGQAIQIQSMANATVGTSSGRLVIYVQNVGDGAVSVNGQSVYVNRVQYATNVTSATTIPPQSTLVIGTSYSLITVGSNSVTVDVKVTTEGGTFSEVTDTFP